VLSAAPQLPTLWDPAGLVAHLALWAGVPAVAVAAVVGLLGLYQSAKGWVDLASATAQRVQVSRSKIREITSERQRAVVQLAVCSVLAVAFSYMLAVILTATRRAAIRDPNVFFSVKLVKNAFAVTQWSPAAVSTAVVGVAGIGLLGIACIADLTRLRRFILVLGGLAFAAAWFIGWAFALEAVFVAFVIIDPANRVLFPTLVAAAVAGVLGFALTRLLRRIYRANVTAFNPR
jgi:hypothetical protein